MARRTVVIIACVAALFTAPPASAHQKRIICGDSFTAGWGQEPPYSGAANSVQLLLANSSGKPIVNVPAGAIKVEVSTGAHKLELALNPTFDPDTGLGARGDYRAWFVPTTPGTYSLVFSGKIGACVIRNASFTSSETTFDDIKDVTRMQFPVVDPPGNLLSDKLDKVQRRLEAQLSSARSSAKTLGFIGIGLGGFALVLAALALTKKR